MNTAILLLALFGAAPVAVAAEAERARGEALVLACAVCHGTAGRSPGAIPAIHGKPARAIVRALKDFRDGRKPATVMGLADASGWCPVDPWSFESQLLPGVHVIGDSADAGRMPKSGVTANNQAKAAALAIVAALRGGTAPAPSFLNVCYSLVAPDYGISDVGVYEATEAGIVGIEGAGGTSPGTAEPAFRRQEADYARGWYASIIQDVFG